MRKGEKKKIRMGVWEELCVWAGYFPLSSQGSVTGEGLKPGKRGKFRIPSMVSTEYVLLPNFRKVEKS